MAYTPYYPNGWVNGSTAITAAALNNIESGIQAVDTNALQMTGIVPSNTDVDSVTTPGMYAVSGAYTYTNLPAGITYGNLIVARAVSNSSFISQILLGYQGNMWTRFYSNNAWSAWAYHTPKVTTASNNTYAGITTNLRYNMSAPNLMRLTISGKTTADLTTNQAYQSLWNANTFLTNAVGTRGSNVVRYVISGNYKFQVCIESSGLIKIGYASTVDGNTSVAIPSGASIYVDEIVFIV